MHHHYVVALESGEYIRVGLEGGQQVLGHVARAAAGLAGLLDRVGGVRGVGGFQRCGVRFNFALVGLLFLGVFGRFHAPLVQLVHARNQLVRGELQAVGAGHARDEAQAVPAVLDQAVFG